MQKAKVRAGAKICLAGSGGGHFRQLLDLEPAWRGHDAFFVTEDTALGESLAEHYRCLFVPHVAMGQASLGAPLRLVWNGLRHPVLSTMVIRLDRPAMLMKTGAGAMFFAMLCDRDSGV